MEQRIKLITILTMALIPLLAWPLALSNQSAPIVERFGIIGCVVAVIVVAVVSAWLLVGFLEELRRST